VSPICAPYTSSNPKLVLNSHRQVAMVSKAKTGGHVSVFISAADARMRFPALVTRPRSTFEVRPELPRPATKLPDLAVHQDPSVFFLPPTPIPCVATDQQCIWPPDAARLLLVNTVKGSRCYLAVCRNSGGICVPEIRASWFRTKYLCSISANCE
jgi:hypothetical protein